MSGYTQLTQGQRYQVEALYKAGHNCLTSAQSGPKELKS